MEEEANKLKMLQTEVDHRMTTGTTSTSNVTTATSTAASSKRLVYFHDIRSIYYLTRIILVIFQRTRFHQLMPKSKQTIVQFMLEM